MIFDIDLFDSLHVRVRSEVLDFQFIVLSIVKGIQIRVVEYVDPQIGMIWRMGPPICCL